MNGGKDKKLTVYAKNTLNKKPNLEIETNTDNQTIKTIPSNPTLPQNHTDEINNKNTLVMTSPTNFKTPQNNNIETP